MPVEIKLKDVDRAKVEKALEKANETCRQCATPGSAECTNCYVNHIKNALTSFLKDEPFNLAIDWKVLKFQHAFNSVRLQKLLLAQEDICLHCGILHIDNCFINFTIQCTQLLLFKKIIPRSTGERQP
jgi:hypothetical protein